MVKLTLVLAVLTIGSVSYAKPPQKIVGGIKAKPGEFPFIVALVRNGQQGCAGSIIDEKHILTAAHCFYDQSLQFVTGYTVRAGSTISTSGGKIYNIKYVYHHPDYIVGDTTSPNDIAVIELTSPIQFNANIKKIPIASSQTPSGVQATAIGWGFLGVQPLVRTNELRKITLKTLDPAQCQQRHRLAQLYNAQICIDSTWGHGTCLGDSGGPLVYNNQLIGIVSWGEPCAKGLPDVFTSVPFYQSFIDAVLKGQIPPAGQAPVLPPFFGLSYFP